ncbi:putative hydrolase of the HAD superfamily [Geoalkalibacter ferrihydriticus]|uniref:5'-nucleotidase n=2 Tax=Geoalkalibacter ferrihydriticus TaxID=392333 RepID=A0A0C2HSE6_9BACT|nr:pyrimidine 5'-nucleotidase [Geoalkalibacter ferrihydriticus]KIH75662.1 5'-nucleotidase [Geoalkalibacter ferrihydriticus DSM 17813]SDM72110.1 putative hydrolase of the HAD superfamily [Geoalkalibacter ferrihydriticus]
MNVTIFDLDNTLYAPERELFSLIDVRINSYMSEVVGIPLAQVDGLRRAYWKQYGVTLGGLMRHYQVDPEDYLEYVHDVDVQTRLLPDPGLRAALRALDGVKVVFTNGSRGHAERVLAALGLSDEFSAIFDVRVANYLPKPYADPYRAVLRHLDTEGERCVMVEDSLPNLKTAKELGMKTILVGPRAVAPYVDVQVACAEQAAAYLGSRQ